MKRTLRNWLILAGLSTVAFTVSADAQTSRTNQIFRPCPASTTPASVKVTTAGSITFTPCSGQTVGATSFAIPAFTQGSALFAGPGGLVSQDNVGLFYDTTAKTLKLADSSYNVAASGWNSSSPSVLQIGNNNSPFNLSNGAGYYGGKFDVYTSQTAGSFTQTSGLRVRAQNAMSGGSGITTGVESFVNNVGASATTTMLQAVEGIAQSAQNTTDSYGGYFQSSVSSGGSGTTVGHLVGVKSLTSSFNQFTATNSTLFWGQSQLSNGPTTNMYGLRLDGWTGSAVTNSYGIYMDTSIDRGSTSRYAIFSSSTSQSFFGGTVALANGSAVASAATISITGNLFHVTGTTGITAISTTKVDPGTCTTMIFDGALTVTDNNTTLNLAGNFTTTADDTLTVCYDGSNWRETARSVN